RGAAAHAVERGVLRRFGATQIARAQRLLGLLHGLAGSVEIFARIGAGFVCWTLRLAEALANLRLTLAELVAALPALLRAANAARFRLAWLLLLVLLILLLLIALLLLGVVAERALRPHRLRELVHALLHLLLMRALALAPALALLCTLSQADIEIGQDV